MKISCASAQSARGQSLYRAGSTFVLTAFAGRLARTAGQDWQTHAVRATPFAEIAFGARATAPAHLRSAVAEVLPYQSFGMALQLRLREIGALLGLASFDADRCP